MDKNLSQLQVKTILDNAPKGTDPKEIVNGLVSRGYILQGLNEPQKTQPQGLEAIGNIAVGAGKGLVEGLQEAGSLITDQLPQMHDLTTGQPLQKGFSAQETAPQNPAQEVGHFIGKAAPYLVGGEAGVGEKGLVAGAKELTQVPQTIAKVAGNDFVKNLITPELTTKATADAIKTGKVTEATGLKGSRDISQALPNFENIHKAVSEVPNLSADKTLLENANAIHDHIGTIANDLVSQLKGIETQVGKDRGFFSPSEFKSYMTGVRQTLADNPTIVGDSEKTAEKILTKFNSLVKEKGHTPTGLLEARKGLDSWMSAQKGSNVFDPKTESAVSVALRAIRQGGNDFLSEKVPDVAVKELLAKQSALYDAIENIAPKAAKEGATGLQQWIKAHPKTVKALKYGAGVAGLDIVGHATGITP